MKKTFLILTTITVNVWCCALNSNAQYTNLFDVAGSTNGSYPECSLFYDGIFLYGMSYQGGTNDIGTLFKIKSDGSAYSNLLDFDGFGNGSFPTGSLISDITGGPWLYGMTQQGGTNNMVTIFKIMPDCSGYSKLLDFAGTANGSYPYGSLFSDGTYLYGTTEQGGVNGIGTIFKYQYSATGIADNNDKTYINVYPNPATHSLTFSSFITEHLSYKIFNIAGEEIQSAKINSVKKQIDIVFSFGRAVFLAGF